MKTCPLGKPATLPSMRVSCNRKVIAEWLKNQPAATDVLGSGLSARVYSWKGSRTALKVARTQASAVKLEQEAKLYQESATWTRGTLINVPQSYGFFINRYKNLHIPDSLPFIAMERLQPLSPEAELRLKHTYHSNHWNQKPQRLWRLYMGLDRAPELQTYFADDYPLLSADAMNVLGLPMPNVARDMGLFIARLTFQGGWNAKDVEFVVSGKNARVFCIDFGEMQQHQGRASELVAELYNNNPYYPQRQDSYREDFAEGYMQGAKLAGKAELAYEVLEELHRLWYLDRCSHLL